MKGGEWDGTNIVSCLIFGGKIRLGDQGRGSEEAECRGGGWGGAFSLAHHIVRLEHMSWVTVSPAAGSAGKRQSPRIAGGNSHCGKGSARGH